MDKEKLMEMTKEQLIELLLLAIEGQQIANKNSLELVSQMTRINADAQQLRDEKATLEAELIVLRARP
jgi:hypothetical protein